MEIVSAIASKIVELLIAPIGRPISYVFNYEGNLSNLKKTVKKLEMTKVTTQHDVDLAERQGEEIESDVRQWLSDVNNITGEIDKILVDGEQATKNCFMGSCPNLKSRYQLSRKAKKKLEVVFDLQREVIKFDRVSYPAASQARRVIPPKDYEAFESRTLVLNQILEALKKAEVNMIELYGMGGVGKTSLVKKVAEQVRKHSIFDVVVFAVVSKAPVLRNIQGEIADGLGFKLEAETVNGRANLLRDRLEKEKKILVILDDIWERLELEDVGIPSGSDHEGCKLLMTSRSLNVLSRDMGVLKDNFMLQVLPGNEAWNFFERMVGTAVQDPSLQSVVQEVAERCAGLPILLATVARALKNGNLSEWKDALERLKNKEEMDAQVPSALDLSYEFLKGDEIKSLFLLCGQLVPHCIWIRDLLMYATGLGLFKRSNSLEAARHRLHTYLKDLKASCLLVEGNTDGAVKMHDIVHQFAASIASRDHRVLAVAYGTALNEWPTEDELEQCTAISLPYCEIPELPAALKCPETESLILYGDDISPKIQDDFFREMKKLKVVDLSDLHLLAIPSSLQFLENLQTLCLDRCDLGDIAIIGEMKRLLVLSLQGSNIVRLPREIGQLTRLQLLNLSNNPTLVVIPPNVLSCLTQLEDLYMEDSFLRWEDEGSKKVERNASLAELKHLQNLLTLDIHITDAKLLPKDLFLDKLERFRILIGDGWNWLGKYEASRTLKLKLNTSILFEAGIQLLLKRTEDLHLHDLKGVTNIVHELEAQGFHLLKHLHIEESLEIQYIVDSIMMGPSIAAFPRLESLSLDNLNSLEKICNGPPKKEIFSRLRILKIETCHRLKNVFSLSLAGGILQLEEIGISNCKIMEVIVAEESEGDAEHKDEVLKLSQVRTLTLERLPQLKSICSKVNGASTSQTKARSSIEIASEDELETPMPAFNKKIVFPNLEDLKLSTLRIEMIWSDQSIDLLAHLERLEICDCNVMEEIIAREGAIVREVAFPKLGFLKLSGLRNLIRFCTSNLIECPFLKELQIENCHAMEMFISNSVTANTKSTLFDENVLFLNLEELQIFGMNNLKMIWHNKLHSDSFCKLKALKVGHGKRLLKIFPPNMLRRFQNLEKLVISDCDELEEVFDLRPLIIEEGTHSTTTTQLRTMDVRNLPNLKSVWNGNPQEILSFQNLHSVIVWKCPSLQNLFPTSVALDLLQLEVLNVDSCGILEEIVAKEEGVEEDLNFVFPKITSLQFWRLPELKRFYPRRHTLELSMLKKLTVYHCDKMTVFESELQSLEGPRCREKQLEIQVHQPLFSFIKENKANSKGNKPTKSPTFEQLKNKAASITKSTNDGTSHPIIIPNLLELSLSSKEATIIRQGQFPVDILRKLEVLELQCFHEESAVFPFDLLIQRVHNLEKLVVSCSLFKELFSRGVVGEEKHAMTLARIKCLKLNGLLNLERIWNQDLLVDQLIKNLEKLEAWSCYSLTNLAPSTTSFQNLRSLDVWQCKGLIYLIASSTARSLGQLTAMTVRECKVITEIVANEEDESEDEIVFRKLESLRLDCLASLTSFCSANFTFKFPSLTEVILKQCPKMETFCQRVLSAPKLKRVLWLTGEKQKGQWTGDLNKTIQQLSKEALKEVWHGEVLGEIFCDLKSLMVEDCASFLSAISSNLLLSLNNLEELDVRNCESLEEVFNLEGLNSDQGHVGLLSKLERFQLIDLLKLRNVWNERLHRIFDFRGLKLLKVHNCRSLKNIFTPSIAAVLVQLQELEVKWCPMIEEIITKGLEEEVKTEKIIFPQLNSIILESLPNLTSFYCGRGVVECPSLKIVCIVDCLSTFSSAFLRQQEPTNNGSAEPEIGFSNLESMELSSIKLEKIWHDRSWVKKLTSLTVEGCGNLRYFFTSSMVESLAQLQKLKVYDCKRVEEIIVTEHLGEGENGSEIVFPKLSSLELKGLPKFIRFCICNLIKCPSLKLLRIEKCPDLKTFVSNSVSAEVAGTTITEPKRTNSSLFDDKVAFPNLERLVLNYMDGLEMIWHHELHSDSFCMLKKLEIEQGKKLLNIFPPKMLRRFKNLEYFDVTDCASLEEVFDLQFLINEKEAHDVTATQLREMYLWKLPSLKHVWNGNPQGILSFKNLHAVDAWKCPALKSLFPSSIAVDLLQLEKLEINECGIEEIVSKEEGVEAFPRNSNLQGPFKEDEIEIQVPQPFLSIGKITPNLEEFALNSKDTTMIWESQFPADFFHKIKALALQCFHDESEDFPFGLLQRFQNMETLVVRDGHFKQLFPDGLAFEEEHATALTRIRHLILSRLPDLEHIWNQHFQVDLLLPNLGTLQLLRCSSVIYLAPPTASFWNLTVLNVYQCKALIYLVTSSTAKHLVQLTKMTVEECDMVTEVVSIQQEEAENEIIIFKKLEYLTLISLASLTCFCPAKFTFKFPSLVEVTVIQCPKMKIFSPRVLSTPELEKVWLTRVKDRRRWKGNLNSTIQQLYTEVTRDKENLDEIPIEVASLADRLFLLSALKNLKNSPLLNPQQLEIVRVNVENADSLVTYHPFYEQQIDLTRALKFSMEDNC
ncbi:unnamed protein product [Dovyalis caffra]|uniref:AAA+ ATPase domain-containing protein n=1 Tax=Dovyalis caffra TaxID=77055 RepID=A0AAV1RVY4_9ROSI|nr:unnamed protein product [Dovyalis caffra]